MKRPDSFRLQDCSALLPLSLHLEKSKVRWWKKPPTNFTKPIVTFHLHLHRFLNSFRKSYVSDLVPIIAEWVSVLPRHLQIAQDCDQIGASALASHQWSSHHLMLWIPQASLAALMARTIWMFRFSLSCVKNGGRNSLPVAFLVWIRDSLSPLKAHVFVLFVFNTMYWSKVSSFHLKEHVQADLSNFAPHGGLG